MRITGGTYRGRVIATPKTGDIRPTQDRVREALFSMLMNEVPSCRFLDLFSGSGAVGFEALSRGAREVTFVERDARHVVTLKKNLAALGATATAARVVRADAFAFASSRQAEPFDIVFADPPYALWDGRGVETLLAALAANGGVREGGICVAEMLSAQDAGVAVDGWRLLKEREYGKTKLVLWQFASTGTQLHDAP